MQLFFVFFGLLESVFEDYDMVRREVSAEVLSGLEIWAAFFRGKAHILRRGNEEWPAHKILLQLTVEHADDSPLTLGAEKWLGEGGCPRGDWHGDDFCSTGGIPYGITDERRQSSA